MSGQRATTRMVASGARHTLPDAVPDALYRSAHAPGGVRGHAYDAVAVAAPARKLRTEAAFDDDPEQQNVKGEARGPKRELFGSVGTTISRGLTTAGNVVGAIVAALPNTTITWPTAGYSTNNGNGASTTVERAFSVSYRAVQNAAKTDWQLEVASIAGGADITVKTGGSRDPITRPPTTEAEATDAVNVMKGYYARGSRGAWHTETASKAHELHHYKEWQCSADHYWPATEVALERLTVPVASHPTEAAAIAAMRAGATGADAKVAAFKAIARQYWFTLADNASSRPYAAGQLALNPAIQAVQVLSLIKGWAGVPSGVDTPSAATPCYQPWLPYNP